MARPNYGPQVQQRTKRLLEALLNYANGEWEEDAFLPIQINWQTEKQLVVRTKVRHLVELTNKDCYAGKLSSEQIREALKRLQDFVGILEDNRPVTQGSEDWHFTLKLWFQRREMKANLRQLEDEWERRRPEKSRQIAGASFGLETAVKQPNETAELEGLVQAIREKVYDSIQTRCGYMRVLDMAQPLSLNAIYVKVNIFEGISGRQRRATADLLQKGGVEDFNRFGRFQQAQLSGQTAVEQYPKLILWGKPGSGKTTFLRWLAVQCNEGDLWGSLIPVFITLRTFAETKGQPELLDYIRKQWTDCGVLQTQALERLLQQGRVLLLLDGLDEVREADHKRVLQEIGEFSTRFCTCRFVMTCRLAAREYTFEPFTEVEIADFEDQQIADFVTRWFEAKNDHAKAERLIQKLQDKQWLQELASNPLLLTLLCLVFQDAVDLPPNRCELYQEALHVLLKRWDARRNIERAVPDHQKEHQTLSLQQKEALLSQIAFTTFERGEYFFKQQAVEQYIDDFLRSLATTNEAAAALALDSEAILKAIESQHGLLVERARGIYSFSHLTFHEYFTAKKIADSAVLQAETVLQALANHILEKEWREVFLLTVNMLPSADALLLMMKAQADAIPSLDERLQQFLVWLDERARTVESSFKPIVVRSHYAALVTDSIRARALCVAIADNAASILATNSDVYLSSNRARNMAKLIVNHDADAIASNNVLVAIAIVTDLVRVIASDIASVMAIASASDISNAIITFLDKAIVLDSDPELKQALQACRTQLPDPKQQSAFKQWWQDCSYPWLGQLRNAVIRYQKLEYNWQFNQTQATLLEQYYSANYLLIECLNSGCYVSPAVRDEIEVTMLLSIEQIEQARHESVPLRQILS